MGHKCFHFLLYTFLCFPNFYTDHVLSLSPAKRKFLFLKTPTYFVINNMLHHWIIHFCWSGLQGLIIKCSSLAGASWPLSWTVTKSSWLVPLLSSSAPASQFSLHRAARGILLWHNTYNTLLFKTHQSFPILYKLIQGMTHQSLSILTLPAFPVSYHPQRYLIPTHTLQGGTVFYTFSI